MILSDLEELGLKKEEAKVYLSLLELKSSYVSLIAKKAGINRVACYHTLEKLIRKGLISSYTQNKIKYFSVETPQILVNKQEELFHKAQKILPELLSMTNSFAYKPKIQYYEGIQGIKNIFEDTLTTKDEVLGYTNLKDLPHVISEEYLRDYIERRMNKKIKIRMLSTISEAGKKYLEKYYPKGFDHRLVEILFVNPEQFHFEYEINIYDDKVSIVSLNPEEMIGMIIQSPIYARTQKAIFNLAWLGATAFVAQ